MNDEQRMRRLSRKGFLWSGAALLGGYGSIKYLASRSQDMGTPWPFRRVLDVNGDLWTDASSQSSVRRFETITKLRQNGDEGLGDWDPSTWKLRVEGIAGEDAAKTFTLAQIKALPRHEMTTELCCIEGWSMVVHWAGARFADFIAAHPPITQDGGDPDFTHPENLAKYVALETPDGGYYVGLDMPSAMHPDTLLCYEMNGKPLDELEEDHGAPLRLAIPVKYGIKNLKRIGTIRYTNDKPKDYWAEQGYDWHAGL